MGYHCNYRMGKDCEDQTLKDDGSHKIQNDLILGSHCGDYLMLEVDNNGIKINS